MSNFNVPLLEEDVSPISSKSASQEAFYAAGVSGQDPISEYETIKTDLEQTGQSEYLNIVKRTLATENEEANKLAVMDIVNDNTISPELKKSILQNYAVTKYVAPSLKEQYINKVAAQEVGESFLDEEHQDFVVNTLNQRKQNNELSANRENIEAGQATLMDWVKGLGATASNIVMSIPAGYAGLFHLATEKDPSVAPEVIAAISQAGYMPEGEGVRHVQETIGRVLEKLSIPAKWIGDKTLELTGSPGAATGAEIIFDPINFIPLGKLTSITRNSLKGSPKIPVDSPLNTTSTGNPAVAEKLAVATLKDPVGTTEAAVGATKGEIVHDWVMPKLFSDEVTKNHPDLVKDIKAIVAEDEKKIISSFQYHRYDPNLVNATAREAEVASIMDIINNTRSPYYIQSKSLITETDELFAGNAVYGTSKGHGYTKEANAQKAYTTLKTSIDQLPPELRGTLDIVKYDGEYFINHQWKRETDELSNKIFGKESIQTSFLGLDVSNVARSSTGRWLFPTGRFDKWVERGALRGEERAAAIREDLTKVIRERIAITKQGKDLDYLINKAEEQGIDTGFSPAQISSFFPKKSLKEVNDLFTTHAFWRRQQQYNYNFMNREVRNDLVRDNMEGLYDKAGNYLGAATSKVGDAELTKVAEVWDLKNNVSIKLTPSLVKDTGGKLVRLKDPVSTPTSKHQYALLREDHSLNLLPQEVLPRIPGYSARKVKEAWYVDVLPKSLKVNGYSESSPTGLRDHVMTKAAASTEDEATLLQLQMQKNYPDHVIEVRPERQDNWGRVQTDYQIHQEMLSHSMKRGERLPSLDGKARIEDRMLTLLNTTNSISRIGAFHAWDEAFQKAFVKGFGQFTKGEFPQYSTDIVFPGGGREVKQAFDVAQAKFKFYERMKNNETYGDFLWTDHLHNIADVLEKWKVPPTVVDNFRGRHQNPLMLAKTLSTIAYIHMAPIRQHLIQPFQQVEMYALNPKTAVKSFQNTIAVRMFLGAEAASMRHVKGYVQEQAHNIAKKSGETEFLENVEAIRRSGMLQSVDLNSIVHGVFKEVDRNLVENVPERIWKDVEASVKVIPRASRTVGFDLAELNNRVGNWLQVKEMWKEKNPGKKWNTKESLEEIATEALRISGAMNRGGALPYQEGLLSIPMQFVAINHKLTMNLFQDNATFLSAGERARLSAVRFALYGGKYGIPGGAIAYYFIEQSDNKEIKENAEFIKRGTIDYAANRLLAAFVEPDSPPDLAVSKILSPYSEGFLPYFQVGWETVKYFKGDSTHPSYPSFGMVSSFGQATEDMQGWWKTREVNEKNYKQMFMEAAEVASGFNHYTQGLLMLGMKDKIIKMGNKYGMEFTKAEAYAKMTFGIGTQKEEDLWKIVSLTKDTNKQKDEMAKMIHRQMINQRVKGNEEEYETRVRKLNSFISLLDPVHFSEQDKLDVIGKVELLDKKSYISLKQSILVDHLKYHQDTMTQERQQKQDIINRTPEFKEYMDALDKGKL